MIPSPRSRIDDVWWVVATATTVLGGLMIPLLGDPVHVLRFVALLAVLPAITVTCALAERDVGPARTLRLAGRVWGLTTLAGLGLFGWGGLIGPSTLLLVLALAVWSPLVTGHLRHREEERLRASWRSS